MTSSDDRAAELQELLAEVRRIDVLSTRLVTAVMAGEFSSVFRGAGLEFDEVREYAEGDDPRSVDWNVTARVGRPFVKKYVDERELTVLFVLDLSASMDGGFGVWSARQTAARVCGCLAFSAVRNGDKVGLVAFSETVDHYVPPKKGAGHALRVVRDCLAVPGRQASSRPAEALEFVTRAARHGAVVFLVSDFLATGWETALALCARRHDVVAVRISSPELVSPGTGLVRVRDPESGRMTVLDWSSAGVREAYARRVEAWKTATATALRRAKVDLMDVPVPRVADRYAVSRPIVRFFRMRELRGAKR